MTATSTFRIGVTGDTGWDLYTEYVKGYIPDDRRASKPDAAYDLYVPAGAAFTKLALSTLLQQVQPEIHVSHLLPEAIKGNPWNGKVNSTLQKHLVELNWFQGRRTDQQLLRVRRVRTLHDKDGRSDAAVFNALIMADEIGDTPPPKPVPANFDMLVIYDGNGTWHNYPENAKRGGGANEHAIGAMDLIKGVLESPGVLGPRVLVTLDCDLPKLRESVHNVPQADGRFWQTLSHPDHCNKICVVCSADMLRREGAAISRRLSWEQSVEDVLADLVHFDKLKALTCFRHLIIRFGLVAALHIMKVRDDKTIAELFFAPLAKTAVYRDVQEEGDLVGHNVLFAAALVKEFARRPATVDQERAAVRSAMKTGLLATMRAFDVAYKAWKRKAELELEDSRNFVEDLFRNGGSNSAACAIRLGYEEAIRIEGAKRKSDQVIGSVEVPDELVDEPELRWAASNAAPEILRCAIKGFGDSQKATPHMPPDAWRVNVGQAIVLFGTEAVFNYEWDPGNSDDNEVIAVLKRPIPYTLRAKVADYKTLPEGQKPTSPSKPYRVVEAGEAHPRPMYVPILTFGKLTLVERKEIESIRSIRNLIKSYLEEARNTASALPLCIAVFGAPGSGKSFAVKQIAEDINGALEDPRTGLEPVEYNVAQFRSVEELGDAITRAGVINSEGKTPLVFFDEFDCDFGGQPLGWLKYFLAPMQDGTFYGVRQTIKIARAIFVFAGGVYEKFEAFDPTAGARTSEKKGNRSSQSEQRQHTFRIQKGPDFVSRLRGHINILPINTAAYKLKPIIRRAIILRGLMEKRGLVAKSGKHRIAGIDQDILYALLTIDRYRHGARSMEAILYMCVPIEGRIEKASLPSSAQLNMHVDADAFFMRMYRARLRPTYKQQRATGAESSGPPEREPEGDVPACRTVVAGSENGPQEGKPERIEKPRRSGKSAGAGR